MSLPFVYEAPVYLVRQLVSNGLKLRVLCIAGRWHLLTHCTHGIGDKSDKQSTSYWLMLVEPLMLSFLGVLAMTLRGGLTNAGHHKNINTMMAASEACDVVKSCLFVQDQLCNVWKI